MLRPSYTPAVLAVLVAVAALATMAAAHTPPPESGDWVVTDWTRVTDAQVHIDGDIVVRYPGFLWVENSTLECGNVVVESGRLDLADVALKLDGPGSQLLVRFGGFLNIYGGSLGSTAGDATVIFESWGSMNGTLVTGFDTVRVGTFGCTVRNCTIVSPLGNGVSVGPGYWAWGFIDVSNNTITSPGASGVDAWVKSDPGQRWQLNVVGNRVVDAGLWGVRVATGHMERAQIVVRDNRVEGSYDEGVLISLDADRVELDADGNRVEGAGADGVNIALVTQDLAHLVVDGITSTGNGGYGIVLRSLYRSVSGLELRDWDASDNALGGVHLGGILDATIWDSGVLNPAPGAFDYTVDEMSTLTVHRGDHGKVSAKATGAISSVTSVRELALRFAWGDGAPCAGRYVEVRDDSGAVVLSGKTDADGRLANITVWEWNVVEGWTSVRSTLVPLLMGDATFLGGPLVKFDHDVDETLAFVDDVPPVLVVTLPVDGGAAQASATIDVEGTCWDDHTGVSEVLVGLSDVPGTEPSSWTPVSGTVRWSAVLEAPGDGTYTVWVRARDDGEGISTVVRVVVVDTRPPWFDVLEPAQGGLLNTGRVTVRGTVEPGATLRVDGQEASVRGGSFEAEALLEEGPNELVVEARDSAGNVGRATIAVTLDTMPPYLWVDAVVDGRLSARPGRLALVGLVEPGATLDIVLGGEQRRLDVRGDGGFDAPLELGTEGLDVSFIATDAAGNRNVLDVRLDALEEQDGPSLEAPLVIGVTAAGVVLLVIGAAATTESGKYSLLLALMPLYAKIKREEVLDNRVRYLLHGHIIDNPGLHFNALLREFGLSTGLATYHLDVLEREGFIRSVRDGTLRRFYAHDVKVPRDRRLTPVELADAIRDIIVHRPGVSQKEIIQELGLPRRAVGYHLQELVRAGEVHAAQRGRNTVYRPRRLHTAANGAARDAASARARRERASGESPQDKEAGL
jgi:DNA-binding transcriptional ArsR family regulator